MGRWSEQDRAADKLRHWADGSRDDAVREAAAAGLSLTSIQEITGLGKTTIMRILNDRFRRSGAALVADLDGAGERQGTRPVL
jgi:hypothetical protein